MSFFFYVQGLSTGHDIFTAASGNWNYNTVLNTMVDLVNDNEYTKFGLNRSISFQVISSIGVGLAPMTSQNGGQDGGYGSNPSPVTGHDL